MNKILPCLFILALLFSACTEEESAIGLGLQDPATLYHGTADTLSPSAAWTFYDDSLLTSGYSQGLIGFCHDDVFGSSYASIFTQVVNTAEGGVSFANSTIDSVVLSLAISQLYPDSYGNDEAVPVHFKIRQLADNILTDSSYYSFDSIPISNNVLYDNTIHINKNDSVVYLKLSTQFHQLISRRTFTNREFVNTIKGLHISLVNDGYPAMLTVNLTGAKSGLIIYRTFTENGTSTAVEDGFSIGSKCTHFNRFTNHYNNSLTRLNRRHNDSITGSQNLYLAPMGGTKVKFDFDSQIKCFKQQHPNAIIHYAELLLPINSELADDNPPDKLYAMKNLANGKVASVPDMIDNYTASTLDYSYSRARGMYHLRITQHLQNLLRLGKDYGTTIIIDGRRSSAKRTVLSGLNSSTPPRIVLVYTEL